ncbi:uncharacterized protein LOC128736187 [Sabethes cyaneus]|uniref:uncharacterized protein LOC128736187 n=1 Tax=Sabethes cyaneus TaxID=53552 RepID=UPI00237DF103|nr:uncharacterized protein LOC128736187 [Sabethes cyaneus]
MADNITVSIKVRPLIKREKDLKLTSQWRIRDNTIANIDGNGEPFVFDHIFDESVHTKDLFERVCRPIVHSTLNGINGTIFAYGQTSSGKTYTMMGDGAGELGVVPLTAQEIFRQIENNKDRQFLIRVGYIEIYNEKIFDLLDKSNTNLKILESQCGDVQLNYKEIITNCPEQIMKYLEEGNKVKRIGDTNMNERSSRSHTIFRITIESSDVGRTEGDENDAVQISTLNLVDLAGSERADQTGATGSRLKEGAHINKSLLSLSCVIQKLSENADNLTYINYRDSKLTRILQASLGGNAVTSMICNITPAALDESYYTLSFAMRAKTIKNKPIVNEVISEAAMMKRLQREIKRLQDELKSEQSKNSKIKTLELQNAITMRANQIINSQTHIQFDKARRRTWCPSSSGIPKPVGYAERDNRLMPPPPPFLSSLSTLSGSSLNSSSGEEKSPPATVRPELVNYNASAELLARKVRSTTPTRQYLSAIARPDDNGDEFIPAELVDFGERSPGNIARDIHTPNGFKAKRRSRRSSTGDAGVMDYEKRCKELEQELLELQEFTNLEKNLDLANIKQQLYSREQMQGFLKNREEKIESLEERCRDCEEELRQKQEQIFDMEKELIVARKECEASVKEAELCRNLQNSVQVEYELFQQKAKNREKELIECLEEARESSLNGSGKKISSVDNNSTLLESTRKELKNLEVQNYELQLQAEECNVNMEKLRVAVNDGAEKIAKLKEVLDRDVSRKDATKLFRMLTRLRSIIADEDLLVNTSIGTDELVDSISETSFTDSTGRSSPTKIVLVNDEGKTNVIYDSNNCHTLDMTIENGELMKKIKLLEEESKQINALLVKYEGEIEKAATKDSLLKQLTEKLEHERAAVVVLEQSVQKKKLEFDKLTSEYNELSTQVLDYVQDIDNYKEQIERMNNTLERSKEIAASLQSEKEQLSQDVFQIQEEKQKLEEKIKEQEEKYKMCKAEQDDIERNFEQKLEQNKEFIASLQSEKEQLSQDVFQIKEENKSLDEEIKEQEEKYKIYKAEQDDIVRNFELKLEQNKEFIASLQTEKEQLSQDVFQIQEEKQRLDEKIREQEEQYKSYKIEQDDILRNFELKMQKLADDGESQLREQISAVEKEFDECKKRYQQLEKQILNMQSDKNELEAKVAEFEREKVTDSIKHKNELDEINTMLQETVARNNELQKTALDTENELTTRISLLSEENSDLQMQLANIENHLKSTAENSETQSETLPKLQQTLDELNTLKLEKESLLLQLEDTKQNYQMILNEKEKTDEKCDKLCNELSLLVSEKERTTESERLVLKNEINDLRQVKYDLEQTAASTKEQISTLTESLADADQQKMKLMSRVQSLEAEIEESSSIREHLDREIHALKTDLGNLEQQLQDNNDKVEQYQKQNDNYEQELIKKSEVIQQGITEQLTLRKSIVQLEKRLSQINEKEFKRQLEEAESRCQEQKQVVLTMAKQKTDLLVQIRDVTSDRDLLKQQVAEKDELLEKAKLQIVSLETNVNGLVSKLDQTESCFADAKQLKEELNVLEKQKLVVSDQLQQIVAEMTTLKEEAQSKDQELERARLQIISLENQVTELKLEIDYAGQALIEAAALNKDLKLQVTCLNLAVEELEKRYGAHLMETEILQATVSELESNSQHFQRELSEKTKCLELRKNESVEINLLHEQITALTAQLKKEKTQYQIDLDSEKELSLKMQQYIKELEQAKLDLQTKMNALENDHKDLLETHSAVIEKNQQLEATNTRQEAQIVNLNTDLVIHEEKLKAVSRDLAAKLIELEKNRQEHNLKLEQLCAQIQENVQLNNSNDQRIKTLEQENDKLRSKLNQLIDVEMGPLQSTIKQLNEQQEDIQSKLAHSAEMLNLKSLELEQMADLLKQEKSTTEQLHQQLVEAKLRIAPDGRPSLGDSKVAQALRKENDDLLKQFNELQKTYASKTSQLQEKIDELKEEISTMRHETSFQEKEIQIVALEGKISHYEQVYEDTKIRHRSLQRQNDELRVKHQNLVMEMDDLRRLADKDRRSRRQSTHDDRRGVWFNTKDSSTMTDPSSSDCSCVDMDIQIKDLRKQLTIKECQLNTEKMMAAANPLKNEVVELRRLIKEREGEIFKLHDETRTLSVALDRERQQLTKNCNNCIRQQRMQSLRSDKAMNTDPAENNSEVSPLLQSTAKKLEDSQEELRKLNSKYQDMKRLCRIRNEKIVSLNQDIVEKENESSIANRNVQQEVSLLKRQLKESEDKYSLMLRKCQSNHFVNKTEKLDDAEMLRFKYEKYKSMAIALMEQNEELKRKVATT